jgi:CRP/FNR family transcriptional regulator, cyclic AMP receptor protein
VLGGVARTFLTSGEARQVTIRYVRPGGMFGNILPLAGDRAPLAIAAVTECHGLEFDAEALLDAARADAATALVVLDVLSRRLEDLYATLAANAFGTTRERIAGHLLELGHPEPESGRLLVDLTQQRLADSVGTVREVAARILSDFRDEGLVSTSHGRIEILDAVRLAAQVGRWQPNGHR